MPAACILISGAFASYAKEGPEDAKAMVEKAIALYKTQGKQRAFAEISACRTS